MLYCINFIHEPYAKTCCSDVADKPAVPKKGRKKAEKVVPLLDFDQLVPDLTYFTRPAREPALDKSALASWTTDSFLLPEEWYGKSQGFGSFIIIKERKVNGGQCWLYKVQKPGCFFIGLQNCNYMPT